MEDARHSASSSGFHMYTHTAVYPRAYPTLYANTHQNKMKQEHCKTVTLSKRFSLTCTPIQRCPTAKTHPALRQGDHELQASLD